MASDLPSMTVLILTELGVVALTAIATWRLAVYHFRQRKPGASAKTSERRLAQLEGALDQVAQEVERLGESQDFVQELLAQRLTRMGLRPPVEPQPSKPVGIQRRSEDAVQP